MAATKFIWQGVVIVIAAASAAYPADPAPQPSLPLPWRTVTAERLANPDPADWPNYRRTYDVRAYSPLDQINTANVAQLRSVWAYGVSDTGGWAIAPLVVNGVMYLVEGSGKVTALDAATGDPLWIHQRRYSADVAVSQAYNRSRGLTLAGDSIYWGTTDGYLVALDARTGQLRWETQTGDYHLGYGHNHPPLVAGGKVFIGHAGGDFGQPGRFRAYDAETGKQLWQFNAAPEPGEPGYETWPKGFPPRGAAPWATISYDPETQTVYFGAGQPGPWSQAVRGKGDALYSNSIIALDARTGRKKWHFQVVPDENWDRDAVFESMLLDIVVNGKPRKALVQTSKIGWGVVIDRETGKFISSFRTAFESIITGWTPQGRPIVAPDSDPQKADLSGDKTFLVCPGVFGSRNLNAAAYSPLTKLYYTGINHSCQQAKPTPVEYRPGRTYTGAAGPMMLAPGHDYVGEFAAIDPATGQRKWAYRPPSGAAMTLSAMTTGGGLVFGGTLDREFFALNAATGELGWHTRLHGDVSGVPITYSVNGRQYVAVPAGGRPLAIALGALTKVPVPQASGAIWVFALPDARDLQPISKKRNGPVMMSSSGVEGAAPAPDTGRFGRDDGPVPVSGKFTAAQASRGQGTFTKVCSACHATEAMTGPALSAKWSGSTAADLFTKISTTMPQNAPGSLSRQEYADIIAFMLAQSGFPAGSAELAPDAAVLATIRMDGRK